MNLENIELSERTKKHLTFIKYDNLTNIQEKVIPLILEGKDIIAQSSTGTGKTASFIIPVLEKISDIIMRFPQALVLVPTRELALQVNKETKKLSSFRNLRNLAIIGKTSFQKQANLLKKGIDIIIGTPGRIYDHLERKTLNINSIKFVILDEVDEMINRGFREKTEKIIKNTPSDRQTLFFSATINRNVLEFSKRFSKNPEYIKSNESEQKKNIIQYYIESPIKKKIDHLDNFIRVNEPDSTIIFANTKRQVEIIKKTLEKKKFNADYIHSGLPQWKRIKILDSFRDKNISFLIATDVLARGIDIKNVSLVVNFDLPRNTESYVHRIGRTGREGKKGKTLSFVNTKKEIEQIKRISRERNYELKSFL